MEIQKTPRRWFRFRLRTLLIMVMVLSVPLGWVGWELGQRRREKEVVAWVEEMGGTVTFAFTLDERSWWKKRTDKWFGERVRGLVLHKPRGTVVTARMTAKGWEQVPYHSDSLVTDISLLAGLKDLERLELSRTRVTDLSPLTELKNLKMLSLGIREARDVSEEQVQAIRLALPNCKISRSVLTSLNAQGVGN